MADMTEEERAVLLRVLDRRGEAAAKRWAGFEDLLPCAEPGLDFLDEEEIRRWHEEHPDLMEEQLPLPDIITEGDTP
jgi:hypothetical protein